jgi:hypothetical protein
LNAAVRADFIKFHPFTKINNSDKIRLLKKRSYIIATPMKDEV